MPGRPDTGSAAGDVFDRYGLTRIINVSGTETVLGASPVCREVLAGVNALAPHSVIMLELESAAARLIANTFGAETGMVVHCTAAGIVMAVAACMTGTDLARIECLPDTTGLANEVILQRGHNITYGGYVAQNIALTGARVVEIGAATECGAYQLRAAITPKTSSAVFVVSHHTVESGLIDLDTFCQICHERQVPVIVDAAAEPDPRVFLQRGADLVISSMHKRFSGLTAAAVVGRGDLVRACFYQQKGIGRPMKVSKEAVIATIAALERWGSLDHAKAREALQARVECGRERLARLPGLTVRIVLDPLSQSFPRLQIHIDPKAAGMTAHELAIRMMQRRPAIAVRNLKAEMGLIEIDFRLVSDEIASHVAASIENTLCAGGQQRRRAVAECAPSPNSADAALAGLGRFPLPAGENDRVSAGTEST